MKHLTAFTLWRLDPPSKPGKKPLKVPTHADVVTNHARGNLAAPLTWQQAEQAVATARALGLGHDRPGEVGYVGVGFRPAGTGYACLDIDNCLVGGQWAPHAVEMMQRFDGAGLELSQSGQGLHVWFRYTGESPGRRGRDPSGRFELYAEGQFIALGQWLQGDMERDHTEAMRQVLAQHWPPVRTGPREVTAPDWADLDAETQAKVLAELRSALAVIPADDRDTWIGVGQALVSLGDVGFDLWDEWSATSAAYQGREDLEARGVSGDRTGYQSIFARAQAMGWANPRSTESRIAAAMAGFGGPVGVGLGGGQVPSAPPNASTEVLTNQQLSPAPAVVGGGPAAAQQHLTFAAAAEGAIAATPANVVGALTSGENSTFLGFDEFLSQPVISVGGKWRPISDEDRMMLRVEFEKRGFKAVGPEVMKSSMDYACSLNRFDSGKQWAESLVWDGVPRVATSMHRYYRVGDTPYTRAVGEYAFTALAGRVLQPGCQADMVPVFIGLQGARKTSAIRALAPTLDSFVGMDFSQRDDNLARKFRGKLVVELAELKGLAGRDQESVKEWIVRREETWRQVYREFQVTYLRRAVLFGTGNKNEFLDDETGERRWLPMTAGEVDVEALERDRDQLWAEGVAMWRAGGIRWQEAERLARDEHAAFKVQDLWQEMVVRWLAECPVDRLAGPDHLHEIATGRPRGEDPVSTFDLLAKALGHLPRDIGQKEKNRVGKIMRSLGYDLKTIRTDQGFPKLWVKA